MTVVFFLSQHLEGNASFVHLGDGKIRDRCEQSLVSDCHLVSPNLKKKKKPFDAQLQLLKAYLMLICWNEEENGEIVPRGVWHRL